jgi:hypothetical protein
MSNVEFLKCPHCLDSRFTEAKESTKRSTGERHPDETAGTLPTRLKCNGCGEAYVFRDGKLVKDSR